MLSWLCASPACQEVSCFHFAPMLLEKGKQRLLGEIAGETELASQPFIGYDLQKTVPLKSQITVPGDQLSL